MKKIVLSIVGVILGGPLSALEKTPADDVIISTISDYFNQFNTFLIARGAAPDKSIAPQPKEFLEYRTQLDRWAHPKTPPKSLKEQQQVNTAKFVLALYLCSGIGGPHFSDDGIRMIQEVLEQYAHAPQALPESIKENFFGICKHFLDQSITKGKHFKNVDLYKALFTLAYLYQLKSPVANEAYAIDYLNHIITAPGAHEPLKSPVDIALRNKARVLLAKVYARQNNRLNNPKIKNLLQDVIASTIHNGVFVGNSTWEDANYALSELPHINAAMGPQQKYYTLVGPKNSMENL